jgi:hypothetical protein
MHCWRAETNPIGCDLGSLAKVGVSGSNESEKEWYNEVMGHFVGMAGMRWGGAVPRIH